MQQNNNTLPSYFYDIDTGDFTHYFYDAVKTNDVLSLRIMMKDSMLEDPSLKQFDAMAEIAKNVPGLWDQHDGLCSQKEKVNKGYSSLKGPFTKNRKIWQDPNYLDHLMVKSLFNFSPERIEHMKDVVRYTRPQESKVTPVTTPKNTVVPSDTKIKPLKIFKGLGLAGGAAGMLYGLYKYNKSKKISNNKERLCTNSA